MERTAVSPTDLLYVERVISRWTEALFLVLAALFLGLAMWRILARGLDGLAGVLLFFFIMFLFYVVNYVTLVIRVTGEAIRLSFGIFTCKIPVENIATCRLDEISAFDYYAGAGIHFLFVRKRYRASFNFLEYPRVVIVLRRPAGPVWEISFSTRRPEAVIRAIQDRMCAQKKG